MSRLRMPAAIYRRNGTVAFRNEAACEDGERFFRRLPANSALLIGEGEMGGIVFLRESRREHPVLCFPRENGVFCVLPRSAVAAVALVSIERLKELTPLLHRLWDLVEAEAFPFAAHACRLVAEMRLSEAERERFSVEHFVGLSSLVFRLLFGEPLLKEAEASVLLADPVSALGVLGTALTMLSDAEAKGRELRIKLRREGETLFLDVMGETLSLGRCRVPALAEVPEPFVFREETAVTAFALAFAAEITFFSDLSAENGDCS